MIPITKPFFPPVEDYINCIKTIYENGILTNDGPFVVELEKKLAKYLGIENLVFVSNGTIAIHIAIKCLELKGEIITTPFSYVATTSSIVWENCTPVFADINSDSLNIDATQIEGLITEKTTGILATHVFGNACEIDKIQNIATKHNLKVIYDGAHCFGVKYNRKSIFEYGDITTTSYHATKLFHTIEGGALITNSKKHFEKIRLLRNFGHDGPNNFNGVGTNGKNSEVHAAMGLIHLNYMEEILAKRKNQVLFYKKAFENSGLKTTFINPDCETNYSYFPLIFPGEKELMQTIDALNKKDIFPRRYFYPSLSNLNYIEAQHTPVSNDICSRILCLPLYHTLEDEHLNEIVQECLRLND